MLPKYGAPLAGFGFGIALILALIAGVFFSSKKSPAPPPATSQPDAPKATPYAPAKAADLQGRIEAVHTIPVRVNVPGVIDSFSAEVGEDVFEGQILARISNHGLEAARDTAQQNLQNAEAKVNELETNLNAARVEAARAHTDAARAQDELGRTSREYERQKMLHNAGATPRNTYEKAEKDFQAAQTDSTNTTDLARRGDESVEQLTKDHDISKKSLEDRRKEFERAQAALTASEIHAPAGGIVVARQGDIGKPVQPKEAAALFSIATNISDLQAVFPAAPEFKAGDTVTLTFADVPGEPISAVIKIIKNGDATATFTSASPDIRPGMSCSVHPHSN